MEQLHEMLDRQSGVVSRRQLMGLGFNDDAVRKLLRRRELAKVHPGVYINHTGPLSWTSRAWAAVLYYEPAALSHESALNLAGDIIHIAVHRHRNLRPRPGVVLHRIVEFETRVAQHLSPPRVRIEHAALDVAAHCPRRADAVALLTDLCQRRRTTPSRLAEALASRRRQPRGVWLRAVLEDAGQGALSVLEQAYLRLERAHGLPRAVRQRPSRRKEKVAYHDVDYLPYRTIVELDGWVWHSTPSHAAADHDRDLDAAIDGFTTIRLGWRQAEDDPCNTALRIGRVLQRAGWQGAPTPCSDSCAVLRGC
ncbi:MAG: type IV toxin-antitoxin system AbiEi family antitoxin domain-containing protein [Nocardioidaceae bacterium]